MVTQPVDGPASAAAGPEFLLKLGREQTEATFKIQKDVLEAYEEASRAWLARVQSEVDLWSQLATKLAATRSIPEALGAYQELVAQRMQLAAEDGKRLSDDCREMMSKIAGSLTRGWPAEARERRATAVKASVCGRKPARDPGLMPARRTGHTPTRSRENVQ